jgi:hypothetical protein
MWNTRTFSCEVPDVLLDFNQISILWTCLRHESPQYKNDHENTSSESRADMRGQIDIHDEANMRFWRLKQTHLKLHTLMEFQGSLSCPQEFGIGPYNEPI